MQFSMQDLIASIGCSVSMAQQRIENHGINRFFDFFDTEQMSGADDGNENLSLKPKTVKMSLPSSDDLSRFCEVDIPLPALAHHRQVHLDKVTVNVRTRLQPNDKGEMMADMSAPNYNDGADTANSDGNDTYGEINLVFNIGEASEGVARVVQNITKTI